MDRILVVDADETVQLQRLMSRDCIGAEEARAILAAQASRADRLRAADDVLENSGTVTELRQAVDRLHAAVSASSPRPSALKPKVFTSITWPFYWIRIGR